MKYRTKPREIEAVEFRGSNLGIPSYVNLRRAADETNAEGAWESIFEVWNEEHSSWIRIAAGDFLRVDDPRDVYPIAREKFEATYEPAFERIPAPIRNEEAGA